MNENKTIITFPPPFAAYDGDLPFAFVSYSHLDKNRVYPEILRLHNLGYRLWYDQGMEPGDEISDQLALAIKKSAIFLVFLTQNAIQSQYVRNEINFASNNSVKILHVYLEKTKITGGLELQFSNFLGLSKFEMTEDDYFHKIANVLSKAAIFEAGDTMLPQFKVKNQEDYKYHVFLTCKERDDDGDVTFDFTLAQKGFRFLSEKGLRLFHITNSIKQLKPIDAQIAIKEALKFSRVLVVFASSLENINSKEVRQHWEQFIQFNPRGYNVGDTIFLYTNGFESSNLPMALSKNEPIIHCPGTVSLENLYGHIQAIIAPKFSEKSDKIKDDIFQNGQTVWLLRVSGKGPDRIVVKPESLTTVGRLADNDVILDLNSVSKRHAEIRYDSGGVIIKDLCSTNGTRVNNKK